ncbi:hypothetical protein J6590_049229 [Homalodisca vitripennis]|nr:hypothetical protein J6590_049229 [Homalodisca vitripennis]
MAHKHLNTGIVNIAASMVKKALLLHRLTRTYRLLRQGHNGLWRGRAGVDEGKTRYLVAIFDKQKYVSLEQPYGCPNVYRSILLRKMELVVLPKGDMTDINFQNPSYLDGRRPLPPTLPIQNILSLRKQRKCNFSASCPKLLEQIKKKLSKNTSVLFPSLIQDRKQHHVLFIFRVSEDLATLQSSVDTPFSKPCRPLIALPSVRLAIDDGSKVTFRSWSTATTKHKLE